MSTLDKIYSGIYKHPLLPSLQAVYNENTYLFDVYENTNKWFTANNIWMEALGFTLNSKPVTDKVGGENPIPFVEEPEASIEKDWIIRAFDKYYKGDKLVTGDTKLRDKLLPEFREAITSSMPQGAVSKGDKDTSVDIDSFSKHLWKSRGHEDGMSLRMSFDCMKSDLECILPRYLGKSVDTPLVECNTCHCLEKLKSHTNKE